MSVWFEGNAFIDGGQVQNAVVTNCSVQNSIITTSSLDMNLANITSVRDPVQAQDAATKKYVDDLGIVIRDFTLQGVSETVVSAVQKGSFVLTISNLVLNGPSAVFHVTKNEASSHSHVVRTAASPGTASSVFLDITWPPNSGIRLSKSGALYDGTYRVKLM